MTESGSLPEARRREEGEATPLPAVGLHASALLEGCLPGLVTGFTTAYPPLADAALGHAVHALLRGQGQGGWPAPLLLAQHHSDQLLDTADGAGAVSEGSPGSGVVPPPYDGRGASPLAYDGALADVSRPALLLIKTADCVPVLAADTETGRYAALHAGWRGAAAGILALLLARWRAQGSSLRGVRVALGPHIRSCCYEVGPDCLDAFAPADLEGAVARNGGATHLDLAAVLRGQALGASVAAEHIEVSPLCTRCHVTSAGDHPYASYRRTQQAGAGRKGRNVSFIGVPSVG